MKFQLTYHPTEPKGDPSEPAELMTCLLCETCSDKPQSAHPALEGSAPPPIKGQTQNATIPNHEKMMGWAG